MKAHLTLRTHGRLALLVALFLALGSARSARAEIVDFNPRTDTVPDTLSADDLAKIEALKGAGFVYAYSKISPGGSSVFGVVGSDLAFVNLETGDVVPLPSPPTGNMMLFGWRGDNSLAILEQFVQTGAGNAVTITYGVDVYNATTGLVSASEKVSLPPKTLDILGASPDLKTLLVLESGSTAPPPFKTVSIGANPFRQPDPRLPEGLPGLVEREPFGPMKLYQAAVGLALVGLDVTMHEPLISLPAGTAVNPYSVEWSPDGSALSLVTSTMPEWDSDRQRNNNPPAEGLPNLGSVNVREALGLLKPEENPLVTGTTLFVFDATSGARQATLKNLDYKQGLIAGLVFGPKGQGAAMALALRSELEGRPNPIYGYSSGVAWQLLGPDYKPQLLLDDPRIAAGGGAPQYLPEGELAFAVPAEYSTHIVKVNPTTGAMTTLWAPQGSMYQMMTGGSRLVFTLNDADDPLDMWSADANARAFAPKRVTDASPDARDDSHIRTREVSWKTSEGQTLSGYYVYPDWMLFPPPTPQPLVVWQQGGPGGQMTNDFGTAVEQPYTILANLGIPVFVANAAGRSVQSPQFFSDMAEGKNFGQLDIRQIKEGVEALVARGIADPKAIGITGCSYGGYFTLQSIRTYPTFYAAANAQCSLVDLFEEFNFGFTPFISYLEGRAPTNDPQEFKLDSPLYGTKDVKTPTLIFHGTNDFLPIPLVNNVHDQLVANGTPARLIRFVGERHGLGMEASQALAIQEQVKFFRDRLHVAPLPPEAQRMPVKEIYLPSGAK